MKKNLPLIAAIFAACMISACGDDDNKNEGTQQPSNGTKIVENNLALCSDGIDNDDNNLADCDDSGCAGFIFCQNPDPNKETSPKTCADGTDNDNNGKSDCEEATCKSFTICKTAEPENTAAACKDGLDNDRDGQKDCEDSECEAFCQGPVTNPENTNELCHDSQDNDGDNLTDCDDPECAAFCGSNPVNVENTRELCSDHADNDGDSKMDCDDPDCQGFTDICPSSSDPVVENNAELCSDGKDNDNSGKADCDDKNCKTLDICTSGGKSGESTLAACSNGTDDDGDGKADCNDPECRYFQVCQGIYKTGESSEDACKDHTDNDGDGFVDCADAECRKYDFCKTDQCPDDDADTTNDDPYKYVLDACPCGETKIAETGDPNKDCAVNISTKEDFEKMKNSSRIFLIKRPIDFADYTNNPIKGFNGTLDGDNMRITGFFMQDAQKVDSENAYECGLFGASTGNPTFKNINLAITLNCTDKQFTSDSYVDYYNKDLYVGALVSKTKGTVQNVMGESKVMLRSIPGSTTPKKYHDGNAYSVNVGGLVGSHEVGAFSNIEVVGNTSAQIEWEFLNNSSDKLREINIGGVVGKTTTSMLGNVNAPSTVTLDYNLENSPKGNTIRVGGIAGYAVAMDMCSNTDGTILVNHENGKNDEYNHYIGGLVGQAHRITNSAFTGAITSNGAAGAQTASAAVINPSDQSITSQAYAATNIGGIAGFLAKDSYTGTDKDAIDSCFVNADMTLIVGPGMHAGGLLGRMGTPKSAAQSSDDEFYIVNSYSTIRLTLNSPTAVYTTPKPQFYWGGAVSEAAQNGYVLNSHLRTDYKVDDFNITLDGLDLFLGGVVSKNDLGADKNGGNLIDNFVSGGPIAAEESENVGKYKGNMAATYGYYIYESYWDADIYGTNIQTATQSTKQDGSAKPYTFNASGVAELEGGNSVITLLRKNTGHDGGVQSAHLPRGINYSDWKQITDKDGHKVPVPESSWY